MALFVDTKEAIPPSSGGSSESYPFDPAVHIRAPPITESISALINQLKDIVKTNQYYKRQEEEGWTSDAQLHR